MKRVLTQAFEVQAEPTQARTGASYIAVGGKRRQLAYADGSATKLGQLYQGQGGTLPSAAFDSKAVARREGNTESIPLLNGREAVTRRWNPVDNSYKLTAVGKAYYRTKRTHYVVHVPVTIQ